LIGVVGVDHPVADILLGVVFALLEQATGMRRIQAAPLTLVKQLEAADHPIVRVVTEGAIAIEAESVFKKHLLAAFVAMKGFHGNFAFIGIRAPVGQTACAPIGRIPAGAYG
jgi:hypothetical protein